MLFLVVTFHYIHQENKYPYPGIYPTPVEKLESQIKELGKFFDFIGQKDILDALEEKKSLPKRACLLTFDDGLSSQYKNALPLLEKLKIPAIFFVNALPYAEKKACLIHKIHYSRANLSPKTFSNKVLNSIDKEINFPSFQELKSRYLYSNYEEAKLKYLLNDYLTPYKRKIIVERIFQEIVKDEKAWCNKHYISKEGLSELANRSFLGIHSYSHSSLLNYSFENLKKDFKKTLNVINKITNHSLKTISYPYGHGNLSKAAKAAKSVGLKIGFTTEKTFNKTLLSPLLFARVGTNDALGGKFPLFWFEKGKLKLKEPMKEKRKLNNLL